jgi:hypothetical protein
MKSKRTIKRKLCMLVMLSFLACTLFPLNILNIPKANADAQQDLNNSLTWAKAYLDRSYTEFGTTDYNRIANPGFENWNVLGQPDNWNIRIGSNIAKESSIIHSGSYSIKLSGTLGLGTSISPGTWTLYPLSNDYTYLYSAWILYPTLPSSEYRMGINTESSDGLSVYIEMGINYIHQVFAAVIENDVYIYGNTTDGMDIHEPGVWANWKMIITGNTINWFYGNYSVGEYTYTKLASKPMIPDVVLPGVPVEEGTIYVDDTFFGLSNAISAGMRDLPGLPFVIEDVTDDKWMCPAKATQAVQDGNDGPDWGYYGGCGIDALDYGYNSDRLKLRYRWDTECDSTFDGVVMYVELITLDNVNMKCYANITSKADSDHCALWLDNETVIDPVTVGASFDRTQAYGWFTTRFVVRHGTKIAANMYNALGETDKATKLLNLWYGSGYTKDAYDGVWNASNSYEDYSAIPPYKPWAADPLEVMLDSIIWGNIPWFQMNQEGTEHSGIPYRSQLHNYAVVALGFNTGPLIDLYGKSWWECGFTFKMAWACHLLNKYNTSDSSKLAEAKQLIDDVSWNGLGISSETLRVGPALISLYQYGCYVPYANAEYLAALTRYWQLTGDEWYGQRADEVAGILLKVQVKPGDKIRITDSNGNIHLIWRPDNTGGFMCGYKYGGGFDFASNPWWMADAYFWATSAAGLYNRDYAELSSCGWTNHETTLMSYAALYQYNKTGRTPLVCSVDFTMPFFDAQVSTSHSDQGCYSIQADDSGNIRTSVVGTIYGESWSTVTYSWTVELPTLTNFKTKMAVYIPYYGEDGNAVERWVQIYNSSGRLLVSDYDKPLDGVGGISHQFGERYIMYTNMTPIDSLNAGIYTFKLTFRFSCGWAGSLCVGYALMLTLQIEPMHIETFGCNFDAVPTPLMPKYYVHIASSGPGTVYPYGDFLIDEGQTVNSTATPEPDKYFWYWIINNTALGIYWNFTTNPLYLYVDHDYDATAYFGDTPEPPPPNRTLVISNSNPTLGTISPSPGNYSYVNGTSVTVTATPNSKSYFNIWLLDSQRYSDNPITSSNFTEIDVPTAWLKTPHHSDAAIIYLGGGWESYHGNYVEYSTSPNPYNEAILLYDAGYDVYIPHQILVTRAYSQYASPNAILEVNTLRDYIVSNYTYIYLGGSSAGGAMVTLGFVYNNGTNENGLFDSVFLVDGWEYDWVNPAPYITIPTCVFVDTQDSVMHHGTDIYNTLGSTVKEIHYFNGGHCAAWGLPEIGTGKTMFQILNSFMTKSTTAFITVTMDTDHTLVASFIDPTLYFGVYDKTTGAQLLDGVEIYYFDSSWIKLPTSIKYVHAAENYYIVASGCPPGTYDFRFAKSGYYAYVVSKTIPEVSDYFFPSVYLNPIVYAHGLIGGRGGPFPIMSELVTFYAAMPYSNETQYADFDHYIRVQVLPGTSGTLKLVIHYDTDYPIFEIDAENLTLTEFDLEAVYQHYCLSSYEDMQQVSLFTGLKISSSTPLQINLEMPQALDFWHRPAELLKIGEDGGISSFSSWQCTGRNLTLNFEPGDPTISMLFHSQPDSMTLVMWNLIPFIFIVGSIVLLIGMIMTARGGNFKEFAVLLVGFLIVTALIPIVPQLMA